MLKRAGPAAIQAPGLTNQGYQPEFDCPCGRGPCPPRPAKLLLSCERSKSREPLLFPRDEMISIKPRIAYIIGFIALAIGLVGPGLIGAQSTPGVPTPTITPGRPLARSPGTAAFVPGHLVVKFKDQTSLFTTSNLKAAHGLHTLGQVSKKGAELVQVTPGREEAELQSLRQQPEVESAELNYIFHVNGGDSAPPDQADLVPTDQYYASGPSTNSVGQWDMTRINMPGAWAHTLGASSTLVAVLDSGIDLNHPDLATQWTYAPGATAAQHVFLSSPDRSCPPASSPNDDAWMNGGFSHGTHVSGTIAGASTLDGAPAVGIAGEAPRAKLLPIKVMDCTGAGNSADTINSIEFAATHGASVINMSFGGYILDDRCPPILQQAIDDAWNAGALIVAAAGNDGGTPTLNLRPNFPAACNHVLAVGASDNGDQLASFSQQNATVGLVAPGVGILSSVRSGVNGESWGRADGTSMATPHVAGCAALIYGLKGTSPGQVTSLLKSTAVPLAASGAGAGSGRMDCGAAVRLAVGAAPTAPGAVSAPGAPALAPTAGPVRSGGVPGAVSVPQTAGVAAGALGAAGGTATFTLPGGQAGRVTMGLDRMAALRASVPSLAQVSVQFDPSPVPPNAAAAGSLGKLTGLMKSFGSRQVIRTRRPLRQFLIHVDFRLVGVLVERDRATADDL